MNAKKKSKNVVVTKIKYSNTTPGKTEEHKTLGKVTSNVKSLKLLRHCTKRRNGKKEKKTEKKEISKDGPNSTMPPLVAQVQVSKQKKNPSRPNTTKSKK